MLEKKETIKKVGIFTEGGAGIGLGHLTRCHALAYALREKGYSPVFFVLSADDVTGFLRPFTVEYGDWKTDAGEIISKKQLSFAIVDSYLASRDIYDTISRILRGNMLIIDDYMRLKYPKSLVVNPSIGSEALEYPMGGGLRYALGKDYIILRPEFWKSGPKDIKDTIRSILVTLGGSADKEISGRIASLIRKNTDADIRVLDSYQNRYSALQIQDMMTAADLAVSAGGQTMYELAKLGVPTISITLGDDQALIVKALQESGFSFSAGKIDEDIFPDRLSKGFEYMSDKVIRKKCSISGQRSVDGEGAHRLVDIIKGAI